MSAPAAEVMELAGAEAGRLGQDYLGDEHVLLGLLRHGSSLAAVFLAEAGVTLAGARAGLAGLRADGLTPGSFPGSPQALRVFGLDAGEIARRLTEAFGPEAVDAVVRRAGRRSWPGPGARTPLCGPALLVKRALQLAAERAGPGRDIGPEDLLYGVLANIEDPVGTQVSRRGRRLLALAGQRPGRAVPALLLLRGMGVDPGRLRERVADQIGGRL